MLNGLFDIDNRLDYLTENGDMLPHLKGHRQSSGLSDGERRYAAAPERTCAVGEIPQRS